MVYTDIEMTKTFCNLGHAPLRRAIDLYIDQHMAKESNWSKYHVKNEILNSHRLSHTRKSFEDWLWQWGGYMKRIDGLFTLEFFSEEQAVWFSLKI